MLFVAKLGITVGLFAYLLGRIDFAPVLVQLQTMSLFAALAGIALLLMQLGLLALRWHLINEIVEAPMCVGQIVRLTAIGHFFNQVLPSGFAGDGVRAWMAGRDGVHVGALVRAIICDRVVGLLVLALMVSATFAAVPSVTLGELPSRSSPWLITLPSLLGLVSFFLLGAPIAALFTKHPRTRSIGKLTEDLHRVLFQAGARSMLVVALALAVQLLNVAAVFCCAAGMRIDLGVAAALVLVPTVMLVSMMPISVAGWGVREGAMIFGLGLVGITAANALAVSVAFGLLQASVGIPGGALWLIRRSAAKAP